MARVLLPGRGAVRRGRGVRDHLPSGDPCASAGAEAGRFPPNGELSIRPRGGRGRAVWRNRPDSLDARTPRGACGCLVGAAARGPRRRGHLPCVSRHALPERHARIVHPRAGLPLDPAARHAPPRCTSGGARVMKCKSAGLIINPAAGKNLEKLTDILGVLSAAGWKTDTAVKEFPGHTRQLAKDAAKDGHDLVIAYGGDGTLNQVVNGVMASGRKETIVGGLPGGTANGWGDETGTPATPRRAPLSRVNTDARRVDLGHVQPVATAVNGREERDPLATGGRHYFLLMAGLGLDAAGVGYASTPFKKKFGKGAVLF